jgi:hypothetical protein
MDFTDEKRNQATRGLYRLLIMNYNKRVETNIEDVRYFLDNGAYLTNIITPYGIPIHYALTRKVSPNIIQLIKDYGGADFEFKSIYHEWFEVRCSTFIDEPIFRYYSIYNNLLLLYHDAINSHKLTNKILDELNKQKLIKTKSRLKPHKNPIIYQPFYNLLIEYCKVLGIDIEILKTIDEELPSSFRYIDKIVYNTNIYEFKSNIKLDEHKKQWCPYKFTESKSGEKSYEKNPEFFEA